MCICLSERENVYERVKASVGERERVNGGNLCHEKVSRLEYLAWPYPSHNRGQTWAR